MPPDTGVFNERNEARCPSAMPELGFAHFGQDTRAKSEKINNPLYIPTLARLCVEQSTSAPEQQEDHISTHYVLVMKTRCFLDVQVMLV